MTLIKNGMKWKERPNVTVGFKYDSACGEYSIGLTSGGKYRLVAHELPPSSQFPQADCWMREYDTLEAAARQAEMM